VFAIGGWISEHCTLTVSQFFGCMLVKHINSPFLNPLALKDNFSQHAV